MTAPGDGLRALLRIMALDFPQVADVTVTSDGFYMIMDRGDIGFNRFLGRPNPGPDVGLKWARATWQALPFRTRRDVARLARSRNVDLRLFLPRRMPV